MTNTSLAVALGVVLTTAGAGCSRQVDVEKVPVGTEVELVRQDGGVVRGTLAARDDQAVKVTAGSTSRSVPRAEIAVLHVVDEAKPIELPPIAKFREFSVPAGTALVVRLTSPAGSASSRVGDPVEATLTVAVAVDGTEVLPAGSVLRGTVSAVDSAGKVKGRGSLALRFTSVSVAGRDEQYPIRAGIALEAEGSKGREAATIAGPAGAGAIIGAIVGGKKGALLGGAIGGGAGTAVVLSTRGPQVELPRGSRLSLHLEQAVDVRVPINRAL